MLDLNDFALAKLPTDVGRSFLFLSSQNGDLVLDERDHSTDPSNAYNWYGIPGSPHPVLYVVKKDKRPIHYYLVSPKC